MFKKVVPIILLALFILFGTFYIGFAILGSFKIGIGLLLFALFMVLFAIYDLVNQEIKKRATK